MKYLTFILFLFFGLQLVYSQDPLPDRQLSLGVVGVEPTDDVDHLISAEGKVWEWSGTSFVISSDQEIYNNQTVSVGNADFTNYTWDAYFNWKWRGTRRGPCLGAWVLQDNAYFASSRSHRRVLLFRWTG